MVVAIQEPESKELEVGEKVWYVCRVANTDPEMKRYYLANVISIHPKSVVLKIIKRKNLVDIRRVSTEHIERIKPYGFI